MTIAQFTTVMNELLNCGRVVILVHEGRAYGRVPNLEKHQKFHKDEKPKYEDVVAKGKLSTVPAPLSHPLSTLPAALVTGNGERVTETGNGEDHAPQVQAAFALTATPSATAVIGEDGPATPKRTKAQKARSVEVNRRYRARYFDASGKEPTGLDAAFNGAIAKFSDKHAENALAIVDQFFDSPNGFYRQRGWPVELLISSAPALWREVDDKRAAMENLARPQQQRHEARKASLDIELEKANAILAERMGR
jgi:hypothetical protein